MAYIPKKLYFSKDNRLDIFTEKNVKPQLKKTNNFFENGLIKDLTVCSIGPDLTTYSINFNNEEIKFRLKTDLDFINKLINVSDIVNGKTNASCTFVFNKTLKLVTLGDSAHINTVKISKEKSKEIISKKELSSGYIYKQNNGEVWHVLDTEDITYKKINLTNCSASKILIRKNWRETVYKENVSALGDFSTNETGFDKNEKYCLNYQSYFVSNYEQHFKNLFIQCKFDLLKKFTKAPIRTIVKRSHITSLVDIRNALITNIELGLFSKPILFDFIYHEDRYNHSGISHISKNSLHNLFSFYEYLTIRKAGEKLTLSDAFKKNYKTMLDDMFQIITGLGCKVTDEYKQKMYELVFD
jgi:hypothetical protein